MGNQLSLTGCLQLGFIEIAVRSLMDVDKKAGGEWAGSVSAVSREDGRAELEMEPRDLPGRRKSS